MTSLKPSRASFHDLMTDAHIDRLRAAIAEEQLARVDRDHAHERLAFARPIMRTSRSIAADRDRRWHVLAVGAVR